MIASAGWFEIEEDEAQVVVRLTRGGVDFQRLLQHLERAVRVLQLPFDFAEQGQELCIPWRRGERGLELFSRALVAAEIEIDVGEIVARRHELGIDLERLTKFGDGFAHQIRRT